MDAVLRAVAIYTILMVIFRISGKRSLGQITTFDFVLLLIIAEAVQQGLSWQDYSLTGAFLLIVTLVGIDIGLSLLKRRAPSFEKWFEGVPLIIVENGRAIEERMKKARVDEDDVLAAARELRGLERMDQIRYAVLERSGHITIIPYPGAGTARAAG
ncbi:MAG TPA: YetF domain-containing protein [Candidatus Polarisedimenticolia bacterium]|nr:YetF domain-containing protein [Candidatus Polarisedimenticolia bacterium]